MSPFAVTIVEYSRVENELTPNFSYSVTFDGKTIASGKITNSKQTIKDIVLPVQNIQKTGSRVTVTKSGSGQIYSTMHISEFHTDRNAKAKGNGLTVKREYINDKGPEYSLSVGDTVTVQLTVDGLKTNEYYGVIQDELPAGMVPINRNFNNQQYGENAYSYYYNSYDVTDQEITENGVIMSLYQMNYGSRIYTYQARVISDGVFIVPPAIASLMYAPEIYGRSDVQTITIDRESKIIPRKALEQGKVPYITKSKTGTGLFIGLLLIGIVIILLWKRGVRLLHVKEKLNAVMKKFKNHTQKDSESDTSNRAS